MLAKLVVRDGQDDGVVGAGFGLLRRADAVFVPRFVGVDPGVVDVDLGVVVCSSRTMSTTRVLRRSGQFSLKVRPMHQNARAIDLDAPLGHAP